MDRWDIIGMKDDLPIEGYVYIFKIALDIQLIHQNRIDKDSFNMTSKDREEFLNFLIMYIGQLSNSIDSEEARDMLSMGISIMKDEDIIVVREELEYKFNSNFGKRTRADKVEILYHIRSFFKKTDLNDVNSFFNNKLVTSCIKEIKYIENEDLLKVNIKDYLEKTGTIDQK